MLMILQIAAIHVGQIGWMFRSILNLSAFTTLRKQNNKRNKSVNPYYCYNTLKHKMPMTIMTMMVDEGEDQSNYMKKCPRSHSPSVCAEAMGGSLSKESFEKETDR